MKWQLPRRLKVFRVFIADAFRQKPSHANELAKFQEKALREYLSTLVADKNSAVNRMARARHAEARQVDAAAQND